MATDSQYLPAEGCIMQNKGSRSEGDGVSGSLVAGWPAMAVPSLIGAENSVDLAISNKAL